VQLGIESVLYLILYFYLDQVLPNEYGIKKHPLFFLKCFSGSKKTQKFEKLLDND